MLSEATVYLSNIVKRNRAVAVNPPNPEVDLHITEHGSDWLWSAFSVFSLIAVVHVFIYAFTSVRKSGIKKSLIIIPIFLNTVFAFAYYTYASNLGYTWIETEFQHAGEGTRQIFYSRFVAWYLGWPLVLLIFFFFFNTKFSDASDDSNLFKKFLILFEDLFTRFLAISVFVLGLLIGALIRSTYKWGYFTFSVVFQLFAMFLVAHDVVKSFRSATHSKIGNLIILAYFVVWILYPVCWGLSEGGNVIQPDSEAVFYGILDLITFSFIPTILTWIAINNVDEDFFTKVWHFHLRSQGGGSNYDNEKIIGETPRHSGDTAVAPAGVPSTAGPIQDEEQV